MGPASRARGEVEGDSCNQFGWAPATPHRTIAATIDLILGEYGKGGDIWQEKWRGGEFKKTGIQEDENSLRTSLPSAPLPPPPVTITPRGCPPIPKNRKPASRNWRGGSAAR